MYKSSNQSYLLKFKLIFLPNILRIFFLLLAFQVTYGWAHEDRAYSHDESIGVNFPDWMEAVPNERCLKDISMPGTHDTMALHGGDIVQTQSMKLGTQLLSGVRVVDIRCRRVDDSFTIHHGQVYQHANFNDVLLAITQFLQQHPSETVLMRVGEASDVDPQSTVDFVTIFNSYVNDPNYSNFFWRGSDFRVILNDVRGKIVLLRDFKGGDFGLVYSSSLFNIQDHWKLTTNADLYDKWTQVKQQLVDASSNSSFDRPFFINYLSGSTGSFPYFVASGHSSPSTSAPRLATGRTTPGWKDSYPDFPRVDCWGTLCTIAYEGTNILTRDYIIKNYPSYVGIIMADFPGAGLMEQIISTNFR